MTLAAPTLARLGWLPFDVGVVMAALGGAAATVLSVQCVLRYRATKSWDGDLSWAIPLALVVVPLLLWAFATFGFVRDVATSLDSPPRFQTLEPVDAPNATIYDDAAKRAIRARAPKLRTLTHSSSKLMVLGRALIAAKSLPGWNTAFYELRGDRIEGTTRSKALGLTSQVVITVREQGKKTLVDIRARSNVGISDFGENARLVKQLEQRFAESWICKPSAPRSKS